MNLKTLTTSLLLVIGLAGISHAQGWQGIVPLQSTRQDVEKRIGLPTESNGITYDLQAERVSIYYVKDVCAKGWPYGWNLPTGVVEKIVVYPQSKQSAGQLGLNLKEYEQSRNERLGLIGYKNEKEGINFTTKENGEVEVIQYGPPAGSEKFLCPEAVTRMLELKRGDSAYLTPMSYSKISPEEEKTRLEAFYEQVQRSPKGSRVFIIGYGGIDDCPNESVAQTNRARDILVKLIGLDPKTVVSIDGGRKNAVSIELYIVPPDGPKPLSTPDIHPNLASNKKCH